jgi:polyisoprenoid-binding protein YceI
MKKAALVLGVVIVLANSAFTVMELVNWKIKESAYTISFKGGKVEGTLKGLKATILFDDASPEKSKISALIDVSTLSTGKGMMDSHAKSESALDAERYNFISFESASVSKVAADYEAKGKLTIKGVAKEVTLPFTYENKGAEAVFNGKLSIVPKDYGITRMGTPDKLDIEISIPVTK